MERAPRMFSESPVFLVWPGRTTDDGGRTAEDGPDQKGEGRRTPRRPAAGQVATWLPTWDDRRQTADDGLEMKKDRRRMADD